jgi:membrane associated rhomboid family serine protease
MAVDAPARPRSGERLDGLVLVAVMVAIMWAVEVVDLVAGDLDSAGIRPRDPDGLPGIAAAPFLHAGFGHLIGNTIPFVALGGAIALGGLARIAAVTAIVAVVGGLGTWVTGPANTVHIGASGLVFGYAAYLVTRAAYSRSGPHLLGAVAVVAVYGTTLAFGLVPHPGVSWQGHLFGAVGGVVAAWAVHGRGVRAVSPDRLRRPAL